MIVIVIYCKINTCLSNENCTYEFEDIKVFINKIDLLVHLVVTTCIFIGLNSDILGTVNICIPTSIFNRVSVHLHV